MNETLNIQKEAMKKKREEDEAFAADLKASVENERLAWEAKEQEKAAKDLTPPLSTAEAKIG